MLSQGDFFFLPFLYFLFVSIHTTDFTSLSSKTALQTSEHTHTDRQTDKTDNVTRRGPMWGNSGHLLLFVHDTEGEGKTGRDFLKVLLADEAVLVVVVVLEHGLCGEAHA